MKRIDAQEIVYALRDYVDARVAAFSGAGTLADTKKLEEALVTALSMAQPEDAE